MQLGDGDARVLLLLSIGMLNPGAAQRLALGEQQDALDAAQAGLNSRNGSSSGRRKAPGGKATGDGHCRTWLLV